MVSERDVCVSDLVFDQWQAGELAQERARALDAHVLGCLRCAARKRRLLEEAERYRAAPESEAVLARVLAAQPGAGARADVARRSALTVGALGVAIAAVALLGLFSRHEIAATRAKGSMQLGFFVRRGPVTFRGADGERVQPGDRLRFTVRPQRPGYVAILARDGRGEATVYYPAAEIPISPKVEPTGDEIALDLATELDEHLGSELIYGLFCDHPLRVQELRRELASRHKLAAPKGCDLSTLKLHKGASFP
jgi:hypothetical protein